MVSGTALAQALTLAATPILSRLYDPSDFGVLGLFVTILLILRVGASWKYEIAIVLPNDHKDAANILALACLILLFMTLLSGLIMALAGDWIVKSLGSPRFAPIIWCIPVAVLVAGLYDVLASWATRRKNFSNISVSQITQSGSIAVAQTLAGLAGAGSLGLAGGRVAGQLLGTLVLVRKTFQHDRLLIGDAIEFKKMIEMAREHHKFPKYAMPQHALNATSQNLLIFLLIYFFDPAVAGLYWFTVRILRAPSRLIGGSVGRVFYQKAVELYHNNGELFLALGKTTLGLSAIGILPAIVILVFGPVLFDFIFGSAWHQSGVYAQWLVVWWFFNFISTPSKRLIPVFGLQRIFLVYQMGFLLCTGLAVSLGAIVGNELISIALFSIVASIFGMSLTLYMFLFAKRGAQARKT